MAQKTQRCGCAAVLSYPGKNVRKARAWTGRRPVPAPPAAGKVFRSCRERTPHPGFFQTRPVIRDFINKYKQNIFLSPHVFLLRCSFQTKPRRFSRAIQYMRAILFLFEHFSCIPRSCRRNLVCGIPGRSVPRNGMPYLPCPSSAGRCPRLPSRAAATSPLRVCLRPRSQKKAMRSRPHRLFL